MYLQRVENKKRNRDKTKQNFEKRSPKKQYLFFCFSFLVTSKAFNNKGKKYCLKPPKQNRKLLQKIEKII